MTYQIYSACASKLKKENVEVRRDIFKAAENLKNRIRDYYEGGTPFSKIFNDDHIKYDIHGNFFTYKSHGRNKSQIRILYACIQDDEFTKVIIIDYLVKRSNKFCNKEHIIKFDEYNNLSLNEFLCSKAVVAV